MFSSIGITAAALLFAAAAATIGLAGTYITRVTDQLADRTRLGEAFAGLLLLAGATSLPDLAATLSAAIDRRAELAMSNIMGSMAANLAFLGIADAVYRKANLEHAAASSANMLQGVLFVTLLAIPLIGATGPNVAIWAIHPATIAVLLGYLLGLRLIRQVQSRPMWSPRHTPQTVPDVPAESTGKHSLARLWVAFGLCAVVVAAAGWALMESVKIIIRETGLAEGVAGGLLTALSTSLPELVTTIAAVRQGAVTLAVSNILGTNFFNLIVIAVADIAYRDGSIYHAMSPLQVVWGLIVILMTSVLVLGLIRRQTYGIGKIGFESALVLAVYVFGVALLLSWQPA